MERDEIMMLCLAAFLIFWMGLMFIHRDVEEAKQQCANMIEQHQIEQTPGGNTMRESTTLLLCLIFVGTTFSSLYMVTEKKAEKRIIQAVTQCTEMIKHHQEEAR